MRTALVCLAFVFSVAAATALAGKAPSYALKIKSHAFAPATLTVPAGKRIELKVTNTRALPSEFESADLTREKVVPGDSTVTVWIGPLKPGKYQFFDDFNPGVIGYIVVKKPGKQP
jgi:plastocyanin